MTDVEATWEDESGLVTDSDQRTHEQRRADGDPFWGPDPALLARQARAQRLLAEYTAALAQGIPAAIAVLRELFAAFGDGSFVVPGLRVTYGDNVRIGSQCLVNMECMLIDDGPITIGDHVLLAPRVQIITGGHELDHRSRRRKITTVAPVEVHDDAWIGAGAIVLPGVTVGARAVVGAGSVVTKDVPAGVVAAGNPCRVLRPVDA
ncbi:sugar O-acetyltransferase [Demequina activiva]|uniref:Maltose O-acetyltransferase n=1 Tax=Demequina activiva TaxID=1582364 RepID=A0A919Q2V1_9MICO|nr:sugar O-acetyltransferase [Demequina activiva]GIG53408.1 maltose O-acetyltransferase [Demequina activiva]